MSDFVNGHDVRMTERRCSARFLGEAAYALAIAGELGRKNLECDFTIERTVVGAVDVAHRSRSDEGGDAVARDGRAGRERIAARGRRLIRGRVLPLQGPHQDLLSGTALDCSTLENEITRESEKYDGVSVDVR
jgi:hypothetical protein